MVIVTIENKMEQIFKQKKKETGMTKTWIAKKIGISRQSLNILFKTNNPTIESLEKVAYAMNCKVSDLYDGFVIEQKEMDI